MHYGHQAVLEMTPVGFEPTQLALVGLESTPLDHSGKVSVATVPQINMSICGRGVWGDCINKQLLKYDKCRGGSYITALSVGASNQGAASYFEV